VIVNIRGTSGSGKSWLVRAYRDHCGGWAPLYSPAGPFPEVYGQPAESLTLGFGLDPWRPGRAPRQVPLAYRCAGPRPTFVIGSYENECGGCDRVPTQDEICARVARWAPEGDVLFEGLLVSVSAKRYAELDRRLAGYGGITFAFLDTPLELCVARIQARRDARGVSKPLNPANTEDKWRGTRKNALKLESYGCRVRWLPHGDPLPGLLDILRDGRP